MSNLKTKVEIGSYSKLPTGVGQTFQINEAEIVLFKLSNGDVRALENKSPHPKGGTLSDGLVSGEFVYCPVYDLKISLIDGCVQPPDEGSVKTYSISIEDDIVSITI
ncbi:MULTISPECIES: nitrite reductase (NAD(P)H) small subunit [Bacillaceae]|uniref:nitrite reductase (NAD(P)H) small subunit n=1 Tax=Metabacillus sp. 22489 TaxID=3453928 RepID=UPI000BA6B113|nr:nitrite reductase [Bacillus sp. 7586-K]